MNAWRIRECAIFGLGARMTRIGLYAALISVVLVIGSGGFFWFPQVRATEKLRNGIAHERTLAVAALTRRQLSQAYAKAAWRVEHLERKIRMRYPQASLIMHLAYLARRHHLRILGEAYTEHVPGQATNYRRLDCDLDLKGSYADVRAFLIGLRRLPTWTLVREGTLMRIPGSAGLLKTRLRLATYYRGRDMAKAGGI